MGKTSKDISHKLYGYSEDSSYNISPREKAHLLLDNMLNDYNLDIIQENKELRFQNEMLTKENKDKDKKIEELNSQIRIMLQILTERGKSKMTNTIEKAKNKVDNSFSSLIQHKNKNMVIKRLHELIDGKSGKSVGAVLRKAVVDKLLSRTPTEKEFKSEFVLIGSWRAISNYFDYDKQKVKETVDNVIIF